MIDSYGIMDDEEIELDLAALELSELDHDGIDLAPYVTLLRDITARLADLGASAETSTEQAGALAGVFAEEFGFGGDVESYDAPLNADFIRVLDRRRGLPVSLSILYVAAARRMGWIAEALNTPGHVLVKLGLDDSVIIDPFNGGQLVPSERLAALLSHTPGQDMAQLPMTNRAVLVRLLINQASRAEKSGDPKRALTIYERMTTVAPDNADGWWQLARLQLQDGAVSEARHSLVSLLEVTRDTEKREMAVAALDAIAAR